MQEILNFRDYKEKHHEEPVLSNFTVQQFRNYLQIKVKTEV